MNMPGRFRTGSRPSSTDMSLAEYAAVQGTQLLLSSTLVIISLYFSSGSPGRGSAAAVLDGYGVWPGCKSSYRPSCQATILPVQTLSRADHDHDRPY